MPMHPVSYILALRELVNELGPVFLFQQSLDTGTDRKGRSRASNYCRVASHAHSANIWNKLFATIYHGSFRTT